jgi:methylglutaconyl-CoA hydratase
MPRAVCIEGAGKFFCSGADLNWMRTAAGQSSEQNFTETLRLWDLFESINAAPTYTLALVQAGAFGGGLGIIACCDSVIAADDCRFSFSEVKLGLAPATIAPFVAARIGTGKCRNLMLSARRFGADEAKALGLVDNLAAPAELEATGEAELQLVLASSPHAIRETKALLLGIGNRETRDELRSRTARLIAELRSSDEGQEGIRAFLEKREPFWSQQGD